MNMLNEDLNWVQSVPQITKGYCRRRLGGDVSTFELMYGLVPRIYSRTHLLFSPFRTTYPSVS